MANVNVYLMPLYWVPIFFILRYVLFEFVFKPFSRGYAVKKDEKTQKKLSESLSKIAWYVPISLFGWEILYTYGWLSNTRQCWTGFPNPPLDPEVAIFYGIQTSYYIYLLITHVLLDARRNDFIPMLVHHLVTLTLLGFSLVFGYTRMGVIVFMTMDICDVFLECARSANYLGWSNTSNVSFVLLLICWIGLRLGVFPFKIMYSAYYEATAVHEEEGYMDWPRPVYWIFNVSLWILLVLQIYWFVLLIRVLFKILKDGKLTDVTDKQEMKEYAAKEQTAKKKQK